MAKKDKDERTIMTTQERLAEPLPVADIAWRAGDVRGRECTVFAYTNARAVMDRLDEVLGIGGWQTRFENASNGSIICHLLCKLDGEWVEKCDVGSPSLQDDAGDRLKASFSDSLKRAAVHFGIGRYLYRLATQWVAWDNNSKSIVGKPVLPEWAVRESERGAPVAVTTGGAVVDGHHRHEAASAPTGTPAPQPEPQEPRGAPPAATRQEADDQGKLRDILNAMPKDLVAHYDAIEGALARACDAGSRADLLTYRRAYHEKFAQYPQLVQAAEFYWWMCWDATPKSGGYETDPPREYGAIVQLGQPASKNGRPVPQLSEPDAKDYNKVADVMVQAATRRELLKHRDAYYAKKFTAPVKSALDLFLFYLWDGATGEEAKPGAEYVAPAKK